MIHFWRPSLVGLEAIASSLEAIASRLEAIPNRLDLQEVSFHPHPSTAPATEAPESVGASPCCRWDAPLAEEGVPLAGGGSEGPTSQSKSSLCTERAIGNG